MITETTASEPSLQTSVISAEEQALRTALEETRPLFLNWLRDFRGDPFYLINASFPEDELQRWFDSVSVEQFPAVTDEVVKMPWLPVDTLFQDVSVAEKHKLFSRYVRRFEFVVITFIKSGADKDRLMPVTAPVFKALLCLGFNLPDAPSESNLTHGMHAILKRLYELQVSRYVEKNRKLAAGVPLDEKEERLPDLQPGELECRSKLIRKMQEISFRISSPTKEKIALIAASKSVEEQ